LFEKAFKVKTMKIKNKKQGKQVKRLRNKCSISYKKDVLYAIYLIIFMYRIYVDIFMED
jgi:hypothetical protein